MAYSKAEDAKKNHWFSRRHQTSDAHMAAKQARADRRARKRQGTKQTPPTRHSLMLKLTDGLKASREWKRLEEMEKKAVGQKKPAEKVAA